MPVGRNLRRVGAGGAVEGTPRVLLLTTSQSWTCPAGVTSVTAECWGGGGGGGCGGTGTGYTNAPAGGGGVGGTYARRANIPVTPGTNYTVTVGAGGWGGTHSTYYNANFSQGAPGGPGTSSSFVGDGGQKCVASGGPPGTSDGNSSSPALGDSVGEVRYLGGGGYPGSTSGPGYGGGGAGSTGAGKAAAYLAAGGSTPEHGGYGGSAGQPGSSYGGGGGGGRAGADYTNQVGGAGGSGLVRLSYLEPPLVLPPSATATHVVMPAFASTTGYVLAYRTADDGSAITADATFATTGNGNPRGVRWARGAAYIAYFTSTSGVLTTRQFTGTGFAAASTAQLYGSELPSSSSGLGIAPTNDRIVAFARTGYGSLYTVNPATGAITGVGSQGFGYAESSYQIYDVAWSPRGDAFAVAQYSSPYLSMYTVSGNTATLRSVANWGTGAATGARAIAWSADGDRCFVGTFNGAIVVVTRAGTTFTASTTAALTVSSAEGGSNIEALAVSPDGALLAIQVSSALRVASVNGAALTALTVPPNSGELGSSGNPSSGVGWSPQGSRLYRVVKYTAGSTTYLESWPVTGATTFGARQRITLPAGYSVASGNSLSIAT